ncbi:MAG: hypothetical protein E6J19_06905 [Chloroflexi bacterium]|nr:MAG: hypothetical protein E6J19_06905 [Chloroflexota bacterium]
MRLAAAVIAGAVLGGVFFGAVFDPQALPFVGTERIYAVFLLDGQAYFGHLDDSPFYRRHVHPPR